VSVDYSPAPEVAKIADSLIESDHQELAPARIDYVFRSKASRSRGHVVLGKARKITGLSAFLAGNGNDPFFVVEIALDEWVMLDEDGKRALVDHELCHLNMDDEGGLDLRGHDLEEFEAIVRRHGLWREPLQSFAVAVQEAFEPPGEAAS
jgi:predicted metallopeptidase